jgi:NADPH2:quinone reductase
MHYAALNPADAFLALAQYPAKPALPHILGRDGVGEVVSTGDGVTGIRPGQIVGILRCEAGVNVWGTLAEKVSIPAGSVTPVPSGWNLEQMAGAPLVFLTAWQALTQWGELPGKGQALLVTGASGGVGVASVLLGKSLGFTVVALSRNEAKSQRLLTLGADHVFDPADPALRKKVLAAIAPLKIDLAVDSVAGALFPQVIAMLGQNGRVSVVGRSGGPVAEFNTATLFFRRNKIGGVAVGDYTPEAAQSAWSGIVRRLDAANRRPVVDAVFPFDQVKAAFARLAEGPMGKVVVHVAAR